ncbi:MAG: GGDEF domain-containing protein [Clostridiales bacterium]|jgi:diguanylate cyclase (GGDEF)-like protein|nr:GGDEF domain-containing protein [Clostridiales bacterium]
MNSLVTLYNGFLTSVNIFVIVYRLNENKGFQNIRKYIVPVLIFGAISPLIIILLPNLNNGLRFMLNLIALVLVISAFLKHEIMEALINALLSSVFAGLGELFLSILYILPKIATDVYLSNPFHITIGHLIIFAANFGIISLLGKKIRRVIKYILSKHYELMVIFLLNLLAIFFVAVLCLDFYAKYAKRDEIHIIREYVLANGIFILAAVLFIFGGTLYLINSLIASRIKLQRKIDMYSLDDLTGVLNRGAGIRFLEEQLRASKRKKQPITICYMDIDNLKDVNDRFGHREGDRLIVAIVDVIKRNIRETDQIMRIGGDEFVIIFPDCTTDKSKQIMKRIREKIKEVEFTANGEKFEASFCYGFAEYSKGSHVNTVESLLDMADQQMYKYKKLKSQQPMYD